MATKDSKEAKEVPALNRRAIFSKTGKGVQESSGKTSHLSRADRAVLKEIDGKTSIADIALKFDKIAADKFDALILQLDKDGFVREVSSGAAPEPITPVRRTTPPPKASPSAGEALDFSRTAPPPKQGGGGEDMDFTSFAPSPKPAAPPPPKGPAVDLAAAARAQAEAAREQAAFDYKGRQEAEAKAAAESKAKAEAEARAKAEARARAEAEARAKAEAEARAKAEADAKARTAEIEAKAKQARDMALRMAAEAKAKAEAESKDKARLEAELKGKLDEERKAREEAEKRAAEAAERARKELEEKSKREAEELRQRLEAEMKAKLEQERKAREEEDRKRREEEDRRRKEEDERRAKERAKEEAERKQREEEDRKRRAKEEEERRARDEADRKRREEEERRRKDEDERRAKERAKEEAERKQREEEDRKRRAKEEEERRARDAEDRKRRDEEEERRRRAKDEDERREKDEASARRAREETAKPAAPAAAAPADSGDLGSLLSDLDSFGQKEEEEQKAKEEAERKTKQEAEARARAEEERKRREEEDRRRRQEEERRAKAEAERRAKEEEERRAKEDEKREEERRKAEEDQRKKAKEAQERKQAEERAAAQKAAESTMPPRKAPAKVGADDIGVNEEDLDMADVKRDEAAISKEARIAAKQREDEAAAALRAAPRPKKWGKPVAIALFGILVGGIGVLNFMPLGTADFEKAASAALGVPVKVSSARLSVLTGVKVNLEGVMIGDTKINVVRGYPEIGSIFGPKKAFSRLELEGVGATQEQLGAAIFGKAGGADFRVGRIVLKGAKPAGPLDLPALDIDATVGSDGSVQLINISGPITGRITPSGNNASFELSSPSFAVPFVPGLSLSDFGWKGAATPEGVTSSEFDGRAFEGVISGTARVRWGANWTVEGEVRTRGVKVAVFAPALVSEGKVEGRGNYTMSGSAPAKLGEATHLDGSFKIENGVIGNVDLGRALQTGGAQTQGRTEFAELTGQGVYDKGTVQLRQLAISTRAMNASASLDIDKAGALTGKIGAEVKAGAQTLRAVLNISGSLENPSVRK